MRLYEFTNPSNYILPETDATDLVKQSKDIKTSDTTDIADRRLRKKPETKNPKDVRLSTLGSIGG
jgi:hypothetical protein